MITTKISKKKKNHSHIPAFLCSDMIKSLSFKAYWTLFSSSSVEARSRLVWFKFFCKAYHFPSETKHETEKICNTKHEQDLPGWHQVCCSNQNIAEPGNHIFLATPQIAVIKNTNIVSNIKLVIPHINKGPSKLVISHREKTILLSFVT